jgi:DNA-binding MarR family transcriptional regulator
MPEHTRTSPSSADPVPAVAARLRLAVARMARRLRQEASGDLSPTVVAALATIDRHGPMTPSELADAERVKRPTATRSLHCLRDLGLIDRTPDPDDGRSSLVSVNDEGRERLERMRGRKTAFLARRLADLEEDEVATLDRAAGILERLLEADVSPKSGEVA